MQPGATKDHSQPESSAGRRGITVAQLRSRGAQRALRDKGWVGVGKRPHPHCRRLERSRRRSDNKAHFHARFGTADRSWEPCSADYRQCALPPGGHL